MPQAIDEDGNIWEVDAQGNPQRWLGKQGGQQGITVGRPDPNKARKDAATLTGASLNNTGQALDNLVTQATIADAIRKAKADADKAEVDADKAKAPTPQEVEQQGRVGRLKSLIDQINRVQDLYNSGPGTTKGFAGLQDYLPTDANARFDTAGSALSQQGLAAFRVPGTGTVSDRDAIMFDRANLPQASMRDASIEEILRGLRERVDNELQSMGQQGAQWQGLNDQRRDPVVGVNGPGQSSVPPGTPPGGGPVMGLSRGENYTTPADLAVAAAVNKAFNAGGSIEDLVNAARSAGGQITPEDLANFNQAIEARKLGQGVTFNPQATGRRTPLQQAAGAAMTNPFGTAAADAVNMAGMGVLEGLLPDQYGAIRNINPNASMAGQIAGAIAGTEGLAAGARAGLNAVAPSLASRVLGGGAAAQAGRSLLTDTAFGAGYGGITQGDPLTGAALAAGGSVLGQAGGKALGKVMSGVDVAPAAQALRDAGIPLTTGQTVGGIVKGVEDRLSGLPVVGDIVNARRLEGLRAFNEKAMGDAVAPINGQAAGVGNDGIQALYDQVGNAYDNATAGVNVPLDQQLIGEINALRNAGGLPPDYAARLNQALSNRLDPVLQTGQMSGDQFQQAMRGLKGYRASADKAAPGFEQDYRDVLSKAMDALNGQMSRGGGDSVVSGLRSADNAYRNVKTLDKAVTAARNGTGSGEIQIFTPAQLNNAATQAAQKFAGPRPFGELIDNAQAVLPNRVPDSGTAGRLATYALPTVLGGTGAGVGTLAGDTGTGTLSGLALAAALMAGGSKAGQKALEKVLTSRPGVVKKAGSLVRKKSGLFGAATIPPLLASQN